MSQTTRVAILVSNKYIMSLKGNVPDGNWNRDDRKLNLDRNNPDNRNTNWGAPSTVGDFTYFGAILTNPQASDRPRPRLLGIEKFLSH